MTCTWIDWIYVYTKVLHTRRPTQIVYWTLWEECKQTQCPYRSWRERTEALMWYYSSTKNKLIYQVRANTYDFGFLVNMENTIAIYSYSTPWTLFPQKWCVAPEFCVLISLHCSTHIWRIRYGSSWSIFFLVYRVPLLSLLSIFTPPPSLPYYPNDNIYIDMQAGRNLLPKLPVADN